MEFVGWEVAEKNGGVFRRLTANVFGNVPKRHVDWPSNLIPFESG